MKEYLNAKKKLCKYLRCRAFIIKWLVYINLLMIKPFFLIKEKETNEFDEDTEFTAPLVTVIFGRYDNESPPLLMFFLR